MKILVTGGAGFIGSSIVKLLCDLKHQVVVFDNLSEGFSETVDKRATLIVADLKDRAAIQKSLKGIDVVIHMAALIEVSESVKHPDKYFENNVVNGINLLEEMRLSGVKKIIFSSTAAVYAENVPVPIKEDAPKFTGNPYGATKLMFEDMLFTYHKCYGFHPTILRYFNAYGPWMKKHEESHVFPNFIKSIMKGKKVPLYWKGECVRDFVFVEDIAHAHVSPLTQTGFHVYNIGTEKGTRIDKLLDLIGKAVGKEYQIDDLGPRPGDQITTIADVSKIKKELGWKAAVSLEEGIKKTVNWYKHVWMKDKHI
ncbi:UDP-glucose 4-epimerase GalE [candidate division CPR3 bacterium GWF2_35_18]|uniref:UDP-glucose 4-epimerase n=1 Tax=candidate division CPR3 bacterium GW2011_GWF2_35_18 TaxID=1618350 RepID=A0A0G0BLM8_UNCC3|nr:MAG: UDP-glucose 4-epimerase [candidate division CPR3 bacterium GW2011_GWF2_35_18]OGB63541.1 MAG: UDP-glucose 4-epimerase GalE [candidate division CPR3 bacterium GWF2_35_18]OGB64650.1 MAG: UDP-glucose 4-epimerase GalE [candidate division CPR3 bacterium RIFOXYA2_FULL_35_13]OGB78761.1 MAG: UDP-glucose 4-epimerase GalE [candidate division CPR3 bacterium RIFOXYB2_FULL_35_8]